MTINVAGPDGSSVAFPDGTPQADIVAAMDAHFGKSAAPGPKESPSLAEGVMRGAATGMPVIGGLANKIDAVVNAWAAPYLDQYLPDNFEKLPEDTFGERYAHALRIQQGKDQAFESEHPVLNTAANIGGGLASTGLALDAAPTIAPRLLGLTGKTLPGQIGQGIASGSAIGAADAATRGNDIETGALTGGLTGGAAPIVARGIGAVANKIVGEKPYVRSADELKNAADHGFDAVRNMDVTINPAAVSNVAKGVQDSLTQDGVRDYLAPKTFAALKEMQSPPEGAVSTFADLHGVRRVLGKIAGSADPTERMAASRGISALDDYLSAIPKEDVLGGDADAASKAFQDALGNYAAWKRAGILQGKVDAADLQAASANSGANIDNALRQRVKDILNSTSLRRGYNQDELLAMQRVVRGTAPANMIRTVGNMLGGGGGLGALATGATGFMAAGPAGVAAPAVGYVAKKIGNRMTQNAVDDLATMIRSRAPASAADVARNQLIAETNAARRAQLERIIAASTRGTVPALAAPVQ